MHRVLRLTIGICLLAAAPAGAENADDRARAAELIRQLGNRSFEVREQATLQLTQLGPPAKAALLDAAKHADPEVRRRAEQILAIVLDIDFKARLEAFRADKDGKLEHDLAGWKRYRKLIGNDAPSRALFLDMLQNNARLLEEAETKPKDVGERVAYRCQTLMQSLYGRKFNGQSALQLGDVAAMLFVQSDKDAAIPEQTRQLTCNFLYQQVFQNAVRSGPQSVALRKILAAWMNQSSGTSAAQQILYYSVQVDLKEGLDLALKLLKNKEYANGMAVTAVGKWGTKEHLPLLEGLLDEKTVVGNLQINNVQATTEVRDVALAMLVRLTGQQTKDYGFAFLHYHNGQQMFFAPVWLGFADETKRTAAIKKYRDWKAGQKK